MHPHCAEPMTTARRVEEVVVRSVARRAHLACVSAPRFAGRPTLERRGCQTDEVPRWKARASLAPVVAGLLATTSSCSYSPSYTAASDWDFVARHDERTIEIL